MNDLKIAEKELKNSNLNLVIVEEGEIFFKSSLKGVKGLLEAIKLLDGKISKGSAADKIVGRASALLISYMNIKRVFSITLSDGGKEVLEEKNIEYEYENIVPCIKNRDETGICPFEESTKGIKDPEEAYRKIKSKFSEIMGEDSLKN